MHGMMRYYHAMHGNSSERLIIPERDDAEKNSITIRVVILVWVAPSS
jgi:hypothetical protein